MPKVCEFVSLKLMMFHLHGRLQIMHQLLPFPSRTNSALQVFCPSEKVIITSYESYLPNYNDIDKISDTQPHLPAMLCWLRENYDYYAYLPKKRLFNGHLLATLKPSNQNMSRRMGGGLWMTRPVNSGGLSITISQIPSMSLAVACLWISSTTNPERRCTSALPMATKANGTCAFPWNEQERHRPQTRIPDVSHINLLSVGSGIG